MCGDLTKRFKSLIAKATQPTKNQISPPITAAHVVSHGHVEEGSLNTGEEVDSTAVVVLEPRQSTGAMQIPTVAPVPKRELVRPRTMKQTTNAVIRGARAVAPVQEAKQPTTITKLSKRPKHNQSENST
jgi:hypothetical protein